MFNKIINFFYSFFDIFDFNPKVKKIMSTGITVSFIMTLFATFLMSLYISTYSYILYDLGIALFKTSTTFIAVFFICGIAFSQILKDRI